MTPPTTPPTPPGRPDPGGAGGEEPTRADPLSTDRLLRACARTPWEGVQRPVLGRILVTAPVGKGGMGAVYRGVHRTLGQERAVKVLLASADDSLRERFLREARFAAQIDSPHLVRVHDADEDPASGLVYLEMEYVRGVSAAQWMREAVLAGRAGVPEDDALVVCAAACRGLEAAHAAGVVHRDLKPGNILLPEGPGGRPRLAAAKVADLGLARSEEADASLTATNTFVGTPGFAAPEQIADAKRAGKPADVFSMGATLYALLSGRSPFDGTSSSDTIVRTTLGKRMPLPALRPGLSAGTLAIVERCLAMDPADRYPDATALREAIENRLRADETPTTVGAPWAQAPSEEITVGSPAPPPPAVAPTSADPAAVSQTAADGAAVAPSARPIAERAAIAGPAAPAAPASAQASVAAREPSARSPRAAAWVAGALAVAGLAAVLVVRGRGTGDDPAGAPDGRTVAQDPGSGGAGGAPPLADGTAAIRLRFCPPGARVFVGDREVREGDVVPRAAGAARVALEGHDPQTVLYAPDEKGEIWIRPAEFRTLPGRLVIAKLPEPVQAYLEGRPVSGSIAASVGDQVTIEFRMRGFWPQSLTERVVSGDPVVLEPKELWVWSGAMTPDLAPGARIAFEMTHAFEGAEADAARDPARAAPAETEWEIECLASAPTEATLRLRVTRIRGRALDAAGGAFAFDSADPGWAAVLAAHEERIAAVAPLRLLQHGPIDATFDAEGRASSWTAFPAAAAGLPGVLPESDDDVRRSVIGLLTLRPDHSGVEQLGSFGFTGSEEDGTAQLWSFHRRDDAQVRSKLVVSLRDGLGTRLEIESKLPNLTTRTTLRRK